MSVFLDQKYLLLISNRLPFFKRKSDTLFNCRCILCGDSTKNKRKARGYFFPYKTEIRYKCHNCGASLSLNNFLKQLDSNLHSQYLLEQFSEGKPLSNTTINFTFEEPKFSTKEERLLDKILTRIDALPADHEAVQFLTQRKIPSNKHKCLYFIDNIKDIVQLNESYKTQITSEEPRIVIPFYDQQDQLVGVTCRGIRGEKLRYVTVRIKENVPMIFGLSNINSFKPVYVVEGPLDSLFLENGVAVGSTSLEKISSCNLNIPTVLVYDNQPRNKELCKIMDQSIDRGYQVVIWPQQIQEKDINDMVIAGRVVQKIIKDNTYTGLQAKARFLAWKRC